MRLLPLPGGELFAEGEFFEFADTGSWDGVDENESVGQLPLGMRNAGCRNPCGFQGVAF